MPLSGQLFLLAESEGFEPPVPQCGTTDFESAPFDHSGSSPWNCKNRKIMKQDEENYPDCYTSGCPVNRNTLGSVQEIHHITGSIRLP